MVTKILTNKGTVISMSDKQDEKTSTLDCITKPKVETLYKNEHVRILRERLVWVYKRSPPQIQELINQSLLKFAEAVKEYCQCEERVWVKTENKFACLNCGTRHDKGLEGES